MDRCDTRRHRSGDGKLIGQRFMKREKKKKKSAVANASAQNHENPK